jgi:hypothetical protein
MRALSHQHDGGKAQPAGAGDEVREGQARLAPEAGETDREKAWFHELRARVYQTGPESREIESGLTNRRRRRVARDG